ncbi:DegT/DnrJ/EryC1/StrS family aminotransferase [Amycolatopsis alba]|uniref:DegT/DnrJ/EryC1/StrS family aminotransferase n=1 Tax=Amycolatopsis alba DSM 44262 TaxID=1125972 RepID=A0A229RQP2_AMYAL|nr:DegT/DnrJ/EryC1/StrS family aminotransferase [Amycolatopsis alba]OXM48865.1 DegT/DnrJ/EryC1/StrS family aminotransferase [Amycolatopsis alba DSM 44262]
MAEYRVGRYDYPGQLPGLDEELLPALRETLLRGDYVLGAAVDRFERAFAGYLGARHAVGVNSGTDALILALHALGVGPGDEVITVANTFHASAQAVVRVGATPVLADCRPDNYLLDLEQAEAAVTPRTRAIIVVHLFGQSVDMTEVHRLARRHDLLVLEDCAQAVGAYSGGARVGTTSDAGCWSFAPSKNLAAAGDAGAISLGDDQIAAALRRLRHFGQDKQNEHQVVGFNSRLDTVQALVLGHKLPHLDAWTRQRVAIAAGYRERLAGLPVSFQDGAGPGEHVYHLFQLRTERRDELVSHLRGSGVDAVVRYPHPIHLQEAFASLGRRRGDFPVAEDLAGTTLCLPLYPSMTADQVDLVCAGVREFFSS